MENFRISWLMVAVAFLSHYANGSQKLQFPEKFLFGASSAAYQVEGAWNIDGKTPSIWDTATHSFPEIIADGSNGDVSANSYHFYGSDVHELKQIGFHYYRFSISWSRVLTNGSILNPKGIDYYNKLINLLLENGIEPMVTMYHFDLPQFIQDLGGFANPLLVDYFNHYADVLYENFGDRVKNWITFNEPYNFCFEGYSRGTFPPRIKSPGVGEYLCGHHVLKAHASAYHLYKQKYFEKQQGQIGISLNSWFIYPKDASVDRNLVEKAQEFKLGWFTNPIFSKNGDYPQIMIDSIEANSLSEGRSRSRLPKMTNLMKKSLIGSADFLALNYYTSREVSPRKVQALVPTLEDDSGADYFANDTWTRAKSDWLYVVPDGLHKLLIWIKNKYNNPVVIIGENGFSDDGKLEDDERIEYIKSHLASVNRAIGEGCNVLSYTTWSIIDNFEWLKGYTEKFGIVSVNMTSDNKGRISKKSAHFMKQLVADNFFIN